MTLVVARWVFPSHHGAETMGNLTECNEKRYDLGAAGKNDISIIFLVLDFDHSRNPQEGVLSPGLASFAS